MVQRTGAPCRGSGRQHDPRPRARGTQTGHGLRTETSHGIVARDRRTGSSHGIVARGRWPDGLGERGAREWCTNRLGGGGARTGRGNGTRERDAGTVRRNGGRERRTGTVARRVGGAGCTRVVHRQARREGCMDRARTGRRKGRPNGRGNAGPAGDGSGVHKNGARTRSAGVVHGPGTDRARERCAGRCAGTVRGGPVLGEGARLRFALGIARPAPPVWDPAFSRLGASRSGGAQELRTWRITPVRIPRTSTESSSTGLSRALAGSRRTRPFSSGM